MRGASSRRHPALRALAAGLGLSALLAGCNAFDQQSNIEDLRIIAARTEPAEIMFSALYLFIAPEDRSPFIPIPEYEVSVDVLAFDPRGGKITSSLQLCPTNRGTCLDYDPEDDIIAAFEDDPQAQAEVAAVYRPTVRENRQEHFAVDPSGLLLDTHYEFQITDSVVDSIVRDRRGNPNITPFPIFPRWAFGVKNDDAIEVTREHGAKRMPFTLDLSDPTLPPDVRNLLLGILGIELCGELPPYDEWVEGRTECFYSRPANSNPAFIGFNFVDVEAEDLLLEDAMTVEEVDAIKPPIYYDTRSDLGPVSTIRMSPGDQVTFRPVFLPQAREQYQIYSFDLDAQEITIENRLEDIVIKWYKTHGSLPDETQFQFRQILDATFTAPGAGALDGIRAERDLGPDDVVRDTIVAVIHDQRGGVEFARIIVEYRD